MYIISCINEEYHHLSLWYFVSFVFGIIVYFSLHYEPHPAYIYGLIFASLLTIFLKRYGSLGIFISGLIISFSLGMGIAKYRSVNLEVKSLRQTITSSFTGNVSSIKQTIRGIQVVLNKVNIDDHSEISKLRINVKNEDSSSIMIGDRLKFFGVLTPPPTSIIPGGYDFSFYAWFSGIQATGYALSAPQKIIPYREKSSYNINPFCSDADSIEHDKALDYMLIIKSKIQRVRRIIYEKLLENIGEIRGNFAAAIILGEGSGLDRNVMQNMRYAGISHILCVSGLHLSLVAMLFFISSRFLLNLSDNIAFNCDIKTIAAIISLIGSFGYLLLSGTQIAATRAFIMTSLFILSVIVGRSPYPLRSISIAAVIILVINPEYILHPSFQLSFIAVLSLITGYEFYIGNQYILGHGGGIVGAIKLYIFSNIYSSVIASLATTPIVIFHFYISSNYSVLSNLVVVPIMSFIMMPLSIFSLILMPLGLEYYTLYALGFFIQIVIDFAKWICLLNGAIWYFGYISSTSLIIYIFGFFWLTLWQKKWRHCGWIMIALGVILMFNSPKPEAIYDPKIDAIGVKNINGELEIYAKRMSRFNRVYWANWYGQKDAKVIKNAAKLRYYKNNISKECNIDINDYSKNGTILIFKKNNKCKLVYDECERFRFK